MGIKPCSIYVQWKQAHGHPSAKIGGTEPEAKTNLALAIDVSRETIGELLDNWDMRFEQIVR